MADMTLEEALEAATVDDGTETAYCTVDDDTRLVTIPDKYKKLGVESDEKAKRVWFRFPKLVGNNGVDLSAIGVRINFRNANGDGDIYMVKDVTIDGDYVTFFVGTYQKGHSIQRARKFCRLCCEISYGRNDQKRMEHYVKQRM